MKEDHLVLALCLLPYFVIVHSKRPILLHKARLSGL